MKYYVIMSKAKTGFLQIICETNNINEAQKKKQNFDSEFSKLGYYCDIVEQTHMFELILKSVNETMNSK